MTTGQETHFTLWNIGSQQIHVSCDGGRIVSDAGLLTVRALEKPLRVIAGLANGAAAWQRTFMVGDSWVDGLAAAAAGVPFIAYRANPADLARWKIDPVVTLTDLAILPARLLDSIPRTELRRAAWNEHPIGNGPFRFVAHEAGRRWVFAANPDFPAALGGPPALERFIVVVVDEPTTKLAALTSGEIDFAGIQPAHAAFVRKNPALTVLDYPLIMPYGIVFNTRNPPFDDARVRLAVALALDRREIVDGYLFGFGSVADGPVPPGVPGYAPVRPIPANPDSARRLLGGRHIAFELLTVGSGEGALEQMIQARLAAVGFDVAIRQLELTAFLARVNSRQRDFTAAVLGTPGDPGLGYLQTLAELAGVRPAPDPASAQRLFRDSLPVAFLYHARGVQGINRRVSGVRMDVRGELPTVAAWRTEP